MADENNAGGDAGANGDSGKAADQGQLALDAGKTVDAGKAADGDKGADAAKAADADKGKDAAKGDEGKKADGAKDGDKAPEPVDYKAAFAEVKLPDGMALDEKVTGAAAEIFGKHKFSAEAAKELTSFFVSQQQAAAQQNVQAWQKLQGDWAAGVEADKAITPELKADAKTVFGAFSKESRELLEGYGMTNFGPLIKDLARFSGAIKDDSFVRGDAGGRGANGDARKLYPNSEHA